MKESVHEVMWLFVMHCSWSKSAWKSILFVCTQLKSKKVSKAASWTKLRHLFWNKYVDLININMKSTIVNIFCVMLNLDTILSQGKIYYTLFIIAKKQRLFFRLRDLKKSNQNWKMFGLWISAQRWAENFENFRK